MHDSCQITRDCTWFAGPASRSLSLCRCPARADEPCKLAKGGSPMAKPCAEGGIKQAKES